MTRKEAQEIGLKWIEDEMSRDAKELDDICLMSPRRGKDHWTYREFKKALLNDEPLDGMENETKLTPVDDIIRYYEYKKRRVDKQILEKKITEEHTAVHY